MILIFYNIKLNASSNQIQDKKPVYVGYKWIQHPNKIAEAMIFPQDLLLL